MHNLRVEINVSCAEIWNSLCGVCMGKKLLFGEGWKSSGRDNDKLSNLKRLSEKPYRSHTESKQWKSIHVNIRLKIVLSSLQDSQHKYLFAPKMCVIYFLRKLILVNHHFWIIGIEVYIESKPKDSRFDNVYQRTRRRWAESRMCRERKVWGWGEIVWRTWAEYSTNFRRRHTRQSQARWHSTQCRCLIRFSFSDCSRVILKLKTNNWNESSSWVREDIGKLKMIANFTSTHHHAAAKHAAIFNFDW